MPVYKDEKHNTWRAVIRYTDWTGERKQTQKRGFPTQRDAKAWEREQLIKLQGDCNMLMGSFVDIYLDETNSKLKLNTVNSKEHIIRTKILPYFADKKLNEIKATDIIKWQNTLINKKDKNGKSYSPTYLKSIHNQMSAILNHAVKFYGLRENVARKAGSMGKKESDKEMLIWTQEEYEKFSYELMDKPVYYYAFELLYWCGIREGELIALTAADFDFEKCTLRINKSYQRINRKDVITDPKTQKSIRTIKLTKTLCDEIKDYIDMLYITDENARIFPITKSGLNHNMLSASAKAGVKKIRIHDLRHSHVSMLIDLGFSAVDIANRMGHESIDITLRYAHMFPSRQNEMVEKLEMKRGETNVSKAS